MTTLLGLLLAALLQTAAPDTTWEQEEYGSFETVDEHTPTMQYGFREDARGDGWFLLRAGDSAITSTDSVGFYLPARYAGFLAQVVDKYYGEGPSTSFGYDLHEGMLIVGVNHAVAIQTAWLYLAGAGVALLLLAAALWGRRRRRRGRVQRDVNAHQIESREAERARVSREIHDGPVQELSFLAMALATVEGAEAEAARAGVRAVADELRRLAEDLRPPVLDRFGLARALHALTERNEAAPRPLAVDVRTDEVELAPDAELALYRVAQEALTNATRHGHATRASVALEARPGTVSLTVHDDGRGFGRRPSVDQLVRSGHFGLAGMRERVRLVDGTLELDDDPGGGATVVARIPARR